MESDSAHKPLGGKWYGARHTQVILLFLFTAIEIGTRVNLSVAIVAMTTTNSSTNPDVPTYQWKDQSVTLSSYYWGYIIPQVFGGHLVAKFGAKLFLFMSGCGSALCAILIPFVAPFGSWTVMVCRVLQGTCHGFICPGCHGMLSKWTPKVERARFSSFVYAGAALGIVVSMAFTGWICGGWLGWPASFYAHGLVGLVWSAIWVIVGKERPGDHTGIDPEERHYIEQSSCTIKVVATPWRSIFKSLPVWAIFAASCGEVWVFTTIMTNIPMYMANVLRYKMAGTGLLSAAPFLLFWICSYPWGYLTDFIIRREVISIRTARKIVTGISLYVPGMGLFIIAILSSFHLDNSIFTLVMLFVSMGVSAGILSGFHVNHIDLSPAHAGTLIGLTNGVANIMAILAPLTVQFIVIDVADPVEWATVFYVASGICVFSTTFYMVFASGETQKWNSSESRLELDDTI